MKTTRQSLKNTFQGVKLSPSSLLKEENNYTCVKIMPVGIPLRGIREEKNLYSDADQGKMSSSVIGLKI